MSRLIKTILIFLSMIFLFGILINYFGKWQLGKLEEVIPLEKLSQIRGLSPEQLLKPKEEEYQEFITPDGKLKVKYPPSWIEIKDKTLQQIIPKEQIKKYNLKHLFLAQQFTTEGKFAQLIVDEWSFDAQKSFEEIIEEMKASNQEQEWDMKIIESEVKGNEGVFEAKYQKSDRYDIHSKEKIIILEPEGEKKKAYLIAFIAFDKDWAGFEKEADDIIEFAHFTN